MNNVKLVIAGITEKNQLPEKIKELGLEKGIIVKGFLSEKELVYWYNKASVLVAPTLLKEGWTWTSLEAMACGTPSIVTEEIKIFGVNKEFQKVVKKGDEEELASALYNLLTNEKEYKLIKNNGFNIINEYFNKGKIMNKYKKVYNDLCKKK